MNETDTIAIPVPIVAPFGLPITNAEAVRDVWNAFVKPEQDAGIPQSIEMRLLMAILRAVYDGMSNEPVST